MSFNEGVGFTVLFGNRITTLLVAKTKFHENKLHSEQILHTSFTLFQKNVIKFMHVSVGVHSDFACLSVFVSTFYVLITSQNTRCGLLIGTDSMQLTSHFHCLAFSFTYKDILPCHIMMKHKQLFR